MSVAPSEFPPPFDGEVYIGPPTDAEDERLEVGVAIVGGGPAGLRDLGGSFSTAASAAPMSSSPCPSGSSSRPLPKPDGSMPSPSPSSVGSRRFDPAFLRRPPELLSSRRDALG